MNEMDNRVTLSPTAKQILERIKTVDQLTKTTTASIQEGIESIDKAMATSKDVIP